MHIQRCEAASFNCSSPQLPTTPGQCWQIAFHSDICHVAVCNAPINKHSHAVGEPGCVSCCPPGCMLPFIPCSQHTCMPSWQCIGGMQPWSKYVPSACHMSCHTPWQLRLLHRQLLACIAWYAAAGWLYQLIVTAMQSLHHCDDLHIPARLSNSRSRHVTWQGAHACNIPSFH